MTPLSRSRSDKTNNHHHPRGFTLIEILIVIAIIGIMMGSLIFLAGGQIRHMQFRTDYTLFANTINAVQSTMLSSSALPPDGSLSSSDTNYGKVRRITSAHVLLQKGSQDIVTTYEYEGGSDITTETMRNTSIKEIEVSGGSDPNKIEIKHVASYSESCELYTEGSSTPINSIEKITLTYLDKEQCYTIEKTDCRLRQKSCS